MKLIIMALLMTSMLVSVTCDCSANETIPMICKNGKCEGWEGSYWMVGGSDGIFTVRNNTGKPAFKMLLVVKFYDYRNEMLDYFEKKGSTPITTGVEFRQSVPIHTDHAEFDIYYSEDYMP